MQTQIKKAMFDLVPPAMVVGVVLFWMLGPASWTGNSWALLAMTLLITAIIQVLELVHERHEGWRINRKELTTDFFYMMLNVSVIAWAVTYFSTNPLDSLKHALGIATPWAMQLPFLAQVAIVIVVHEFGQYWMHRLMHNTTPFWLTHAPHHHITQLNAMKGAVGNPVELFLVSLTAVGLFDFPQVAVFCAFSVLTVVSTFAHANVGSNPPLFYSYVFTTIRNHSLHHSVPYEHTRCNYGNSLILLDRIFGTYREGEAEIVGQDERKRLSIWEQFVFPFRPVIEMVRGKRGDAAGARANAP